jgi:hypothetical protein
MDVHDPVGAWLMRCVDVRRKSFVAEATSRLAFLRDEYGFVGPEVSGRQDDYPMVMCVSYHHAELDVEGSLVLSYGGEEYLTVTVVYPRADQARARRTEIGVDTAHTGFQLRRASTGRPKRYGSC